MKRSARENMLRENKQQRTERLYSAASKVSQLGLRLDSNPFQIEFLPKFNLLRLALIQAGCLAKRPTGEVNTAGLGVWWVGEAENNMQSQRWKSFQSLTGRESAACSRLESLLSCRARTFNRTNEKRWYFQWTDVVEKAETCKNSCVGYPGNGAMEPAGRRSPSCHQGNKLLPPSFGFLPLFFPQIGGIGWPRTYHQHRSALQTRHHAWKGF